MPEVLSGIVERALQKSPAERYPSAAAFSADLQSFLDGVRRVSEQSTETWKQTPSPNTRAVLNALLEVTQSRPPFRARVWIDRRTLKHTRDILTVARDSRDCCRIGEIFRLRVEAEVDCYVTLIDVGTSGNVVLLLQNHPLRARTPVALSGPDHQREWMVGGPDGVEQIKALFTRYPLNLFPETGSFQPVSPCRHTRDIVTRIKQASARLRDLPGDGWTDHFLAAGLGGQADLDGDGVVSLAELAQYLGRRVGRQAQAVIEEERERSASGAQLRGALPICQERQTPTMFWAGPMDFPLTRGSNVARRGFQPDVTAAARRYVWGELPYRLPLLPQVRYGLATLWGLGVTLSLLSFPTFPPTAGWIAWAVICGVLCGGLWLVLLALAAAANEAGWHAGGYATGWAAAALHLAIFVVTVVLGIAGASWPAVTSDVFPLAAALMVLLSLVIVFGCNEVQAVIVLADLVQRDDRVVLRRAFRHLDRHWLQARLNNQLAMVSAHPVVYQLLGLCLSLAILAHAVYLWFSNLAGGEMYLLLARDFALIVLILWQTQWYPAAYHGLYRHVLPDN